MKDSFVFYASFYEAIQDIPEKSQLNLFKAISELSLFGNEIELSGIEATLFKLIKPQILANNQKYENGCKGGRPKKETTGFEKEKTIGFENKKTTGFENKKPNVNENVNENVNDNVIKKTTPDGVSKKVKTLPPVDLILKDETITKLNERGLDADKVREKFINSCIAKNLKYIDFDRAILSWNWDWDKDISIKLVEEEKCWF